MEYIEFKNLKINTNSEYKNIVPSFILDDGSIFYIEPNFYTQLINLKFQFLDKYDEIINSVLLITKKNKKVIFTGNYDSPLITLDGYIYRDINDLLSYNNLILDIKTNPESDWKD